MRQTTTDTMPDRSRRQAGRIAAAGSLGITLVSLGVTTEAGGSTSAPMRHTSDANSRTVRPSQRRSISLRQLGVLTGRQHHNGRLKVTETVYRRPTFGPLTGSECGGIFGQTADCTTVYGHGLYVSSIKVTAVFSGSWRNKLCASVFTGVSHYAKSARNVQCQAYTGASGNFHKTFTYDVNVRSQAKGCGWMSLYSSKYHGSYATTPDNCVIIHR
jgi:hypothetical protein